MEYQPENRVCQNCHKDFIIEPDDFSFYEKIKVPPPTWCPECRQQRRYAWRNERTLYRRNCDLCGKSTVTIYSPNKELKVYCLSCWWSDKWDPASYGKDFDFSKPFFEQYKELQKVVPRMALLNINSINSEYTNHSGNNKNVYLSSVCFDDDNVFYSNWVMKSRDLADSTSILSNGEKSYECVDSKKIYKCQFNLLSENCVSCLYCYDCQNCQNCFFSSNQRNKSYMFRNKQLTKEEYFKKLEENLISSYKTRKNMYIEFVDLLKYKSIHKYKTSERSYNCNGNFLFDCKNVNKSFDCDGVEDSKYIYSASPIKNSMDAYHVGWGTELSYELHGCKGAYLCKFCHLCYDNQNLEYCDTCHNSSNLFGCISVNKGEYMILNKKYTKEQYLDLKEKIIEHMKKTCEYGEFFPPSIAPVCYNETQGNYYMPLTKEEVLSRGWQWEDKVPGIFGKETIKPEDLPDSINDIDDSITKKILKCINCTKNYNIIPDELTFYRNENIPIPRECPDCRYKRRFSLRLPRKLYDRKCDKCQKEIKSAYTPDRPEVVYCEECYKKEIY